MDLSHLCKFVKKVWQDSTLEQLQAYIRIHNKSQAFDPD